MAKKSKTEVKHGGGNGNRDGSPQVASASEQRPGKRAVIYARVSSKGQEREGYSIDAQLKLLRDYAKRNGYVVAKEFVEVETARKVGRTTFGTMIGWLKRAHPDDRVILVERVDRLTRNHSDLHTLEQLKPEIKFLRESMDYSQESSCSDKLVMNIWVAMAKHYSDRLSEEASKGMQEKARQGLWPSNAPLGYRNVTNPDGRKVIAIDSEVAPIILKMFQWYASGDYSLSEVASKARREGLVYKKTGNPVPRCTVHTILQNPLYAGLVRWNGETYPGRHESLVTMDLWEQVQNNLKGRGVRKRRRGRYEFAFARLITCSRCGCAIVGEIKKGKYIYYHPTAHEGKCLGDPKTCRSKHVREEVLERQILQMLDRMLFPPDVLTWAWKTQQARRSNKHRGQEEAIRRHRRQYTRLGNYLKKLRADRYDGEISEEEYKTTAAEWRGEQARHLEEIERLRKAEQYPHEQGARLPELAGHVPSLFKAKSPQVKRKLINAVLETCSWDNGRLVGTFRPQFNYVANGGAVSDSSNAHNGSGSSENGSRV